MSRLSLTVGVLAMACAPQSLRSPRPASTLLQRVDPELATVDDSALDVIVHLPGDALKKALIVSVSKVVDVPGEHKTKREEDARDPGSQPRAPQEESPETSRKAQDDEAEKPGSESGQVKSAEKTKRRKTEERRRKSRGSRAADHVADLPLLALKEVNKDSANKDSADKDPKAKGYDPGTWSEVAPGARARILVEPGKADVQFEEDGIHVRMPVRYAAATFVRRGRRTVALHQCGCDGDVWCGSQKDTKVPELIAHWRLVPELGEGWRLVGSTKAKLDEGETSCALPLTPDRPMFSVTSKVREALEASMKRGQEAIQQALKNFDAVERESRSIWEDLAHPRPADETAVLRLRPRGMQANKVSVTAHGVDISLRVAMNPVLDPFAEDEETVSRPSWPPSALQGNPSGFRVVTKVTVAVGELAVPLAKRFVGRHFPDRSTRFVRVDAVRIVGLSGNRASIALALSGSAHGEIYVDGHLETQRTPPQLLLRDLSLSTRSKRALDTLYDEYERYDATVRRVPWVDQEALVAELAQTSVFPLADQLAEARAKKAKALAVVREKAAGKLEVEVDDMTVLAGLMDREAARLLVVMSGNAVWHRADVEATSVADDKAPRRQGAKTIPRKEAGRSDADASEAEASKPGKGPTSRGASKPGKRGVDQRADQKQATPKNKQPKTSRSDDEVRG